MQKAVVRLAWALLTVAVLGAPARSRAESPESAKARAKALLKAGNQSYLRHDYLAAAQAFRDAYAAYPSAKILFNEGQAYKALHDPASAADAFAAFLSDASADTQLADKSLEEARAALRELAPLVVQVEVEPSPRGAALSLDGKPVRDVFHLSRAEDPSTVHVLAATAPGYQPKSVKLTLGDALTWAGAHQPLRVALQPVPAPASSGPAPTVLVPVPEPERAPPTVTPSPEQLAQQQKPEAGATQAASAPAPEVGPSHTPALIAFGVAGAFAAGATVVGVMALSQNGSLGCGSSTNPCVAPADVRAAKSARDKARLADLLWLGAAAAGGTGAVLWFVAPGAGSGGEVGLTGHF